MQLQQLQAAQQLQQYPAARGQYLLQDANAPVRADPFIIAVIVAAMFIMHQLHAEQLQQLINPHQQLQQFKILATQILKFPDATAMVLTIQLDTVAIHYQAVVLEHIIGKAQFAEAQPHLAVMGR